MTHKLRSIIFQRDGAPVYFSIDVGHYFDNRFPNRWTGRDGAIRWTPRSPDLASLEFY